MLQFYIPEVVSVEQIFDEADKVLSISNFDHIKAIHFLLQGGAGRACQVGRKDWNEGRPLIETILSVSVKRDSSDIKVTLSENICICTLDWMSDLSTEAAFALT